MPIVEKRLGSNPLHRRRNRIAAELLEEKWIANYEQNKAVLKNPRVVRLEDLATDALRVVVVGAGPSLQKQDLTVLPPGTHFLVCDKALPRISHEITPRAVTALNASSPKYDGISQVAWWWSASKCEGTVLIAPLTADPDTFSYWPGRICPINGALPIDLTDRIEQETGLPPYNCGSNVGVFAYLMAGRLGYREIILVGMDYSFRTREEVMAMFKPEEPYMIFECTDIQKEVRWTTWGWFDSAITFFEYARFFARNGIRTINCTEGGILYDGEFIEASSLKEVAGRTTT